MADLVTKDKQDVVSTGVVADNAEKSLSTLKPLASAARERSLAVAIDGDVSKSVASGKAARRGLVTLGQEGKHPSPPQLEVNDGKHRSLKAFGKEALKEEALQQLDDSPEFEGTSTLVHRTSQTRRAVKRFSNTAQKKALGAAKDTSKGSVAGTKGRRGMKAARSAHSPASSGAATGGIKANVKAAASKVAQAIASAVGGAGAPVVGILMGILAFVFAVLIVSQLVSALFGFWENEEAKRSLEGLPPYITYEMVEEAIACQEEYGHPAGCTIAQIIVESGQGDHMSQLATRDHNLFGIKWASSFASAYEVTGKASWVTGEEYGGTNVTVVSLFTSFKSDVACIRFRSRVFLQASRYANNPLIRQAINERSSDLMAEGLKDAGWATSSVYTESLKGVMDTYNLRRFDGMTVEQFRSSEQSSSAIIAAAYSQLGVPYVWGGTTPGKGLDCSGLTQYCYAQAGIAIPRTSEAQASVGTKLPLSQAQPGDILWKPGHVGIYIGGNSYIHEPHQGDVCRVSEGISSFTSAIRFV